MKILLVEDDLDSVDLLTATFAAYRHTVDTATDGQIGLQLALEWDYDVILLDVMMPKLDGITLCRELRAQKCQTPILMLTAKGAAEDIISGLDAGADDYVTKPYDLDQLLARVRALTRRGNRMPDVILKWGKLALDPTLIRVTYDQREVNLTPKEYSLLELLLRNPQRIFTRSAVIDHLWVVGDAPSQGTVTNLIKDLRQRLKAAGIAEEVVQTIYGVGYRLSPEPTSTSEEWNSNPQELEPAKPGLVEQVTQQFRASISERVQSLESAVFSLQLDGGKAEKQLQLQLEAHRLVGSLGSFGYVKGSDIARAIEHLLGTSSPADISYDHLIRLLQELKRSLQQTSLVEVPATHPDGLILVVGNETPFTHLLQQEAELWGLRVEVADDLPKTLNRVATAPPKAILLSVDSAQTDWIALLQHLKAEFPDAPILGLKGPNVTDNPVKLASCGVEEWLRQPTTPNQVLEALVQRISPPRTVHPTVLMLDDEPLVLQTMAGLLLPWGIQVICLLNLQQFWNTLNSVSPDVLLLDLEMLFYNGLELCRTVRQNPRFRHLPIIVISAHTDAASVQAAIAAGANDVIGKPILAEALVSCVRSQIAQSQSSTTKLSPSRVFTTATAN